MGRGQLPGDHGRRRDRLRPARLVHICGIEPCLWIRLDSVDTVQFTDGQLSAPPDPCLQEVAPMVPIRTAACLATATLIISAVAAPGVASAARIVPVSNTSQLTSALANAQPGDEIRMADGPYAGHFTISRSGTPSAPTVLP